MIGSIRLKLRTEINQLGKIEEQEGAERTEKGP